MEAMLEVEVEEEEEEDKKVLKEDRIWPNPRNTGWPRCQPRPDAEGGWTASTAKYKPIHSGKCDKNISTGK